MFAWLCSLPLAGLLAGCATTHPPATADQMDASGVQRRLDELERRVQSLEERPPLEKSYLSREEIQGQMRQLEVERARLRLKYTDQHPAIRDIDRGLRILARQLDMQSTHP
ncbi:MAG TPA: hypothetical protein PKH69_11285 [Thiobacillaceae bacterium]|nr:hypothetical protein [Thiobacillaceae bacterium]HNU65052.1 hypothetical protein [Thiobacillaceae bacterium]